MNSKVIYALLKDHTRAARLLEDVREREGISIRSQALHIGIDHSIIRFMAVRDHKPYADSWNKIILYLGRKIDDETLHRLRSADKERSRMDDRGRVSATL